MTATWISMILFLFLSLNFFPWIEHSTVFETVQTVGAAEPEGANWDRALDKYNYYLSGEEARCSPLENRLYVVDSNLQKYVSNPNYPQEMLTEVPDHLWIKLPHERKYK